MNWTHGFTRKDAEQAARRRGYTGKQLIEAAQRFRLWATMNSLDYPRSQHRSNYNPQENELLDRISELYRNRDAAVYRSLLAASDADYNYTRAQQALNDLADERYKHGSDISSMQRRATRYAVLGGGGAAAGALAGLAWSLLNKKQRNNKLRNTLIGGALGLLSGGVVAAITNSGDSPKGPDLIDIDKMSV